MWSQRAEEVVAELIARLPASQLDPQRTHALRLHALPIGMSLWADYYLRPDGVVVIVGQDPCFLDVDTFDRSRLRLLSSLVWGGERYPELLALLPAREAGGVDCPCRQHLDLFGPGKLLCQDCGGLGWVPARGAEPGNSDRLPQN